MPGAEVIPTWSPDGMGIAFRWDVDGTRPRGIYRKRIGGGTETLVRDNQGEDDYPVDSTPDGKYPIVVSGTVLVNENNDIWALPADGGEMIPLVTDPGPDYAATGVAGRPLARVHACRGRRWTMGSDYRSVRPRLPEHLRDRRWVVSQEIGYMPRWSPEGDELFFIDRDGRLMGVDVESTGDSIAFSAPRMMFQTPWDIGRNYDVFPKGVGRNKHFAFVDVTSKNEAGISVILHWQASLEEE